MNSTAPTAEPGESVSTDLELPAPLGTDVADGLLAELRSCEELLSGLRIDSLDRRTPFNDWPVGEVAGHLVGVFADVVAGELVDIATLEVAERQAGERRGATPEELALELAARRRELDAVVTGLDEDDWAEAAPAFEGSLRDAAAALTFDALAHRHDILVALGEAPVAHPAAVTVAASHVIRELARRGWRGVTFELDPLAPVVLAGSSSTTVVAADALTFVLTAAGRFGPDRIGLDLDDPVR